MAAKAGSPNIDEWIATSIDHLCGPHVEVLRTMLTAYWEERSRGNRSAFNSLIFAAPDIGLGRRVTAQVLAKELGCDCIEVLDPGGDFTSRDLNQFLQRSHCLLYLHFLHESFLGCRLADILNQAIRQPKVVIEDTVRGEHKEFNIGEDLTLVLACSQPETFSFLLDRAPTIRFTRYPNEDLAQILRQRLHFLKWDVAEDVQDWLVKFARGIPLRLIWLLKLSHTACRAENQSRIEFNHFDLARKWLRQHGMAPAIEDKRST